MKTQTINIDGVIFNYTYNRSTRKYTCEGREYDSKDEMTQDLYEMIQEAICMV